MLLLIRLCSVAAIRLSYALTPVRRYMAAEHAPYNAIQRSPRVIANELVMRMAEAGNVLVMGHRYPDFDSFGACVGVARLAMFCGVPVNIIIDDTDDAIKTAYAICRRCVNMRVYLSTEHRLSIFTLRHTARYM